MLFEKADLDVDMFWIAFQICGPVCVDQLWLFSLSLAWVQEEGGSCHPL